MAELFDSEVTSVGFAAIGKLITLGFSDGSVAILDIETSDILPARRSAKEPTNCPVISLAWQKLPSIVGPTNIMEEALRPHGGLHQMQKGGMQEYSDPNNVPSTSIVDGISLCLTSPVAHRRELTELLSDHLLLSLTADGTIRGHIHGVYPLFCVKPTILIPSVQLSYARLISAGSLTDCLLLQGSSVPQRITLSTPLLTRLPWFQHCGSLHMSIESNISRLLDLITGCGRKWKDACKVVLPKLSLMDTLLATYELNMTPIEFCYTITLCGLWHPAAATAFTQHWNEQGLQRLRSAVDSTSRSIIKLLQTKALPMATNALLCAR